LTVDWILERKVVWAEYGLGVMKECSSLLVKLFGFDGFVEFGMDKSSSFLCNVYIHT
jgi:hypothetical protein